MQVRQLQADRRDEWDEFVACQRFFTLLQSWAWGEVKQRLGWTPIRIAVEDQHRIVAGAQILTKRFVPGLPGFAYVPRGPVGEWVKGDIAPLLISEMDRIARRYGSAFLKIEPPTTLTPEMDNILRRNAFRPSSLTNQPRATIIMDLTRDAEAILREMRDTTRRKIQSAQRKGVTLRIGDEKDLSPFYELMQVTARRGDFAVRPFTYYEQEFRTFAAKKQAFFSLAYFEGQLLAAHISYRFGDHAAFFHQASCNERSNLNPNYLLAWEGIKWAKANGCLTYDLWGIPDEVGDSVTEGKGLPATSRTDGLWGVYRFKSGFSKNVVFYAGAYDHIYSALIYNVLLNRRLDSSTLGITLSRLLCLPGGATSGTRK
jgi:lipid II:glycine glycyltransferase (peptidoglycan interpeptide bridge formation enzyme)